MGIADNPSWVKAIDDGIAAMRQAHSERGWYDSHDLINWLNEHSNEVLNEIIDSYRFKQDGTPAQHPLSIATRQIAKFLQDHKDQVHDRQRMSHRNAIETEPLRAEGDAFVAVWRIPSNTAVGNVGGLPNGSSVRNEPDEPRPTREEIIQALCQLDAGAFEDVINTALLQRGDTADAGGRVRPDPQEGPEPFARWLAQRHLSTDPAIQRIVYLPTGAPNDEIRLLEVNRFLHPPDNDVIEPLDFTPDIEDVPFRVFVADVTRDQWERIQRDPDLLSQVGWQLKDNQIYARG